MKIFSKGEALYDVQLYNYFVEVGNCVEETLLELKKEYNDSFNMFFDDITRLIPKKFQDHDMYILSAKPILYLSKTIKLIEIENKLILKYDLCSNNVLLRKIKKLEKKNKRILLLKKEYDLNLDTKEIQLAHITYMLDTIISKLKQKKYFKFAYYTCYSRERNYDIFINNTVKQLKNVINVAFNEVGIYVDVMDDFNLKYRMYYDCLIKLMLCVKIKYLNIPNIENAQIAICEECNYLFYRENSRKKHCDREWCKRNYQKMRKRKERAKCDKNSKNTPKT